MLTGKKILVTGASSGIGRACSICFSKIGAQIVLVGRNLDRLQETKSQMAGDKHLVVQADLENSAEIAAVFEKCMADNVKLDGLVHCAGIPYVFPLKVLTKERLEYVMNVNFYSYVELCRYFVKKQFSNDNSSIVGISSGAAAHPGPYELGYVASKAAMEASTKVIAQEYGKRRIRANCIEPALVKTELVKSVVSELHNDSLIQEQVDKSVFGWIKPEEIANVCAFLLSDKSFPMTGKIVEVDSRFAY